MITIGQRVTDTVSVYFDVGSRQILDASPLDAKTSELTQSKGIIVLGYASGTGSNELNTALSQQRVDAVVQYLGMMGVARSNFAETAGKGAIGEVENSANRRVDVIFGKVQAQQTAVRTIAPKPAIQTVEIADEQSIDILKIDSSIKENIVLEGLSFIGGRHFPTPESMPVLYKLVETMKTYPTLEIEIQGHICCEYEQFDGIDDDTMKPGLSKNRAQYVYKFLIQNGIPASRMTFVGKGSSEPKVFPEKSPEDEQVNRRVEIKITKYP